MFTIQYKKWYVNGYIDRPDFVVCMPGGGVWCKCKSLHAAKINITRALTLIRGAS